MDCIKNYTKTLMLLAIMITSVFSFAQTVDELGCCLRDNTSGYQIDFDPALYGGSWDTFTITENGVEVFSTTNMTTPYSYIFADAGEFVFTWTAANSEGVIVTSICPFFTCLVEDPTDPSSCCVAVGGSLDALQVKPPDGEAVMVTCETELDFCSPCPDCTDTESVVFTYDFETNEVCIEGGTGSVTNDGGVTLIALDADGCATVELQDGKVDHYPLVPANCTQCIFCIEPIEQVVTCENYEAQGIDICDYITANPDSPLATADCDNGGANNITECEAGTDPTDESDDCTAASAYDGGICAYLIDYPSPIMAALDCDNGSVDNETECSNGTDPDGNPDDDVPCDDSPIVFTEAPVLTCIPQADCSTAAATISCTFPASVNPMIEYSLDGGTTFLPYTDGAEVSCTIADVCQQVIFVIDASGSATELGYVDTQKEALLSAANKFLNGGCVEFGFIKHGTLDCAECCTYFSGFHSDAASFAVEVNEIQDSEPVISDCAPENCGRNTPDSSILGCQDFSNYDVVALNKADALFDPNCKSSLIYSTDGRPEANGAGTVIDCYDLYFALSDLVNVDAIVPFGLGLGSSTTSCDGESMQNFLNVAINNDITNSDNTYIIDDPTSQDVFNTGLETAVSEILPCPIIIRKTAENECGTVYTQLYRDAIIPCPTPDAPTTLTFTEPEGEPVDCDAVDWSSWTIDMTYFGGTSTDVFTDINNFIKFINEADPNGATWAKENGEIVCTDGCVEDVVVPTAIADSCTNVQFCYLNTLSVDKKVTITPINATSPVTTNWEYVAIPTTDGGNYGGNQGSYFRVIVTDVNGCSGAFHFVAPVENANMWSTHGYSNATAALSYYTQISDLSTLGGVSIGDFGLVYDASNSNNLDVFEVGIQNDSNCNE